MLSLLPVRIALLPLLLPQAIAVRRRAQVLPEATGPRQGTAGSGPALRLLIVGDSSAAGVGVAAQEQALAGQLVAALARDFSVHWRLEARSRATTGQILQHVQGLDLGPIDIAVTVLGVNDVTRQLPLRRWRHQQAQLAAFLQQRGAAHIWRCGVPPMHKLTLLPRPLRDVLGAQARRFDAVLAAGSTPALHHLPFDPHRLSPAMLAADGFHPGPQLYALWARDLARAIRQHV